MGKTISREPTEPSEDSQLSPGLTFSSSVSTGDSNNVSLNALHWQSSMVDDQNTLRTMCDEYAEDETWNVEIDRDEYTNSEDRDLARKCLWYLFSIEVPHSLRRGISPV